MLLNTLVELTKFDKSELSSEAKQKLNEFISICKDKEIEVFSDRKKWIEFNQIDFYNSLKGTDENLDKFIEFLIQEYNQYNIDGKSEDEIKKILMDYYNSLSKNIFPKEKALRIIINSFLIHFADIQIAHKIRIFLMENA